MILIEGKNNKPELPPAIIGGSVIYTVNENHELVYGNPLYFSIFKEAEVGKSIEKIMVGDPRRILDDVMKSKQAYVDRMMSTIRKVKLIRTFLIPKDNRVTMLATREPRFAHLSP